MEESSEKMRKEIHEKYENLTIPEIERIAAKDAKEFVASYFTDKSKLDSLTDRQLLDLYVEIWEMEMWKKTFSSGPDMEPPDDDLKL
jgi:hypothetical protein